MNTQPKALLLANDLDDFICDFAKTADELRRLHSVNAELLEALKKITGFSMSQFKSAHDLASECLTVADSAITKATGE